MPSPATAVEWWSRARARWVDGDSGTAPEDIDSFRSLARADRDRVERRAKLGLQHADTAVRALSYRIVEDIVAADMDTIAASSHLALEIATAYTRGRPLESGAPVPGCPCQGCTGIPSDHPARTPARRRAQCLSASDREREARWARRVEEARAIGIIEIAARLGCGDPVRRGRELVVHCPLHADEDPSCTIDPTEGVWYCFPCSQGGDGIDLHMRARRLSFADAVRELVA